MVGDDVAQRHRADYKMLAARPIRPGSSTTADPAADTTIRLWDADTGPAVGAPLSGQSESPNQLRFSPNGRRLASTTGYIIHATARLWDDVIFRDLVAAPCSQVGNPTTESCRRHS